MNRLVPRTLIAQTTVVLVVALMVSHFASLAVYYGDRQQIHDQLGQRHDAELIGSLVRMVNRLTAAERPTAIASASGDSVRLRLAAHPPRATRSSDRGWPAALAGQIEKELGVVGQNAVVVHYAGAPARTPSGPASPASAPIAGGNNFEVSAFVRLVDGSWLEVQIPSASPTLPIPIRLVLSTVLMVMAVVGISVWASRRITRPLATVARAVETLSADAMAARLPEQGPTEVRQMTQTFHKMQRRIRRFIDDRTAMVAAISHDLRTPITRLKLRAEFVEDNEQRQKMLSDLDQMESMIASVLSFAKDEFKHEERRRVDLPALLASICSDISDAGQVATFKSERQLALLAQPLALKRAFTNLIENAARYGKRARVRLAAAQDRVVVRVDDDGPGVPEAELDKIFEPFYRIDGSRNVETGGTGLGLALARSIVRAHGGEIRPINLKRGGLRMEVTLPMDALEPAREP